MARRRKAKAGDPGRAVAYLRVSTDRQEIGPEAQRAAIERWATSRGVRVVAWHADEGVSGAAPLDKRPGALEALAALGEHEAGLLVVATRDRLARDVMGAAILERMAADAGARIVSADGVGEEDTPEAALLRTIVDAFAAYERARISARTRSALAVKRRRGERVSGRAPIGFRPAQDGTGRLVAVQREQEAVQLAVAKRAEGLTYRAVAAALEAAGYDARGGGSWDPTTVRGMILRAREQAEAAA